MKTLKIEVPKGYEIDKEQSTFENIVFKEIKKELPKSWEEYFLSKEYGNPKINYRYYFRVEEESTMTESMLQLYLLREVYRQGWKPDWEDGNDAKWCIIVHENKLTIREYIVSNTFLSFQSEEIASQFLGNFRDLIEKAKPLMS